MEIDRKLLDPYNCTCTRCIQKALIPKGSEICLECLRKEQGLQSWETFCLQCCKKTEHLKGGNRFCWDCIRANVEKFKEEFLASLSDEQKTLYKNFEVWKELWTSVIMLD